MSHKYFFTVLNQLLCKITY